MRFECKMFDPIIHLVDKCVAEDTERDENYFPLKTKYIYLFIMRIKTNSKFDNS